MGINGLYDLEKTLKLKNKIIKEQKRQIEKLISEKKKMAQILIEKDEDLFGMMRAKDREKDSMVKMILNMCDCVDK